MSIYDVPATMLIESIAKDFEGKLKEPEFTPWVKSGSHRERAPQRKDWWFVRTASILYRVYADGPVGTESLKTYYGGRKNRGVKPEKFRKAGGKIIRTCLQALEKEGLVKTTKKGREISAKGEKFLSGKAKELLATMPKNKRIIDETAIVSKEEKPEHKEEKKEKHEEKAAEKHSTPKHEEKLKAEAKTEMKEEAAEETASEETAEEASEEIKE